MDLAFDSRTFQDVHIPVLWGTRAIIQERDSRLSVVDVGGWTPRLEILQNQPAPGIGFLFKWAGFQILSYPNDTYDFDIRERLFTSQTLGLPEVQISEFYVRIGSQVFANNWLFDSMVGIQVTHEGLQFGVPIPWQLTAGLRRGSPV